MRKFQLQGNMSLILLLLLLPLRFPYNPLVCLTLFLGRCYSPQLGNWWQTRLSILPKSNLMKPWTYWTYNNLREELLTGAEIIKKKKKKKTAEPPRTYPAWLMAHERWNPGVYCITSRSINKSEITFSRKISCSLPLPNSSASLWVSFSSPYFIIYIYAYIYILIHICMHVYNVYIIIRICMYTYYNVYIRIHNICVHIFIY